ncbi:MAG: NFACT family protein [Deltaproteobacteria bacterium]|nr:NFACT family protein [Deltaproteobacteria bacterium]
MVALRDGRLDRRAFTRGACLGAGRRGAPRPEELGRASRNGRRGVGCPSIDACPPTRASFGYRQIKRLSKKRDAIVGDLERAAKADDLHEKASLILANITEITGNATYFETTTWGDDAQPVRIELDPRKSPAELAQDLFKKSKRLKRGLDVAPERLDAVKGEIADLVRVRDTLADCSPNELATKLEALGVSITEPREDARKRRQAGTRLRRSRQ